MSALHEALSVAVTADVPVALRGLPGVGKSSLVAAVAESAGMHVEVVIASLREPSDFAGLPVIANENEVRLAPPGWAVRANAAEQGALVFFDELTTAPPATQAALLRVVLERVVGDLPLAPHVRIVAAYNDAADCGGYDLELPVRSRFVHLDVIPDAGTLAAGLLGSWPTTPRLHITSAKAVGGRWRQVVAGFVTARPGMVVAVPDDLATGTYPTPRTWEMAAHLANTAESYGASDSAIGLLLAGSVGHGAASELWAYSRSLDLPDPAALLADPVGIGPYLDQTRPDRALAVLSGVVERFLSTKDTDEWLGLWSVGAIAADRGFGDIVVWLFRRALPHKPLDAPSTPEIRRVAEVLERS